MADEEADHNEDMEDAGLSSVDFFDHEPSKQEKCEMRRATKPPSEWLKLLCRDWAQDNMLLVETADAKLIDYKPYLKGLLSSQLLCRLSIPTPKEPTIDGTSQSNPLDFWHILGIEDEFDKSFIVAQIERFCDLYNIRGASPDDDGLFVSDDAAATDPVSSAASASAGMATGETAKRPPQETDKCSHRHGQKREHRRISVERREQKARDREAIALRKAQERAVRESTREERRRKKLEIREQREKHLKDQKAAALRRAAELVTSNRVPIEITRGAAVAKAAATTISTSTATVPMPAIDESGARKKPRSAIVVSTAGDLHSICTHARNLWVKYNAIAKEHNQKVNWMTVSKELGIHVKVREKYCRWHARAESRGFDWFKNASWKIKDYPEIFLEPTEQEQKTQMPSTAKVDAYGGATVLIEGQRETDDVVAAAAAVLDSSLVAPHVDAVVQTTEEQTSTAAAVAAATLVADPIAGIGASHDV